MDNDRMKAANSITDFLRNNTDCSAATLADEVKGDMAADLVLPGLVREAATCSEPLLKARMWAAAEAIRSACPVKAATAACLTRAAPEGLRLAAFDAVAESVASAMEWPDEPCAAGIKHDQVVWVTTPVRIDLSGGWTDTPPISHERGGCVVNGAVTLNGQYPVQVMAKLNKAGVIRLTSIDLSERVEIHSTERLLDRIEPHHWAALPKAALALAGIGPSRAGESLSRWLKVLGGGLDLTLFSALPKGSGMGTSSILGAAVLACLARVRGETLDISRLNQMTSVLEQRMKTGGGWQDQVGGMAPGLKRILTKPGAAQVPTIRPLHMEIPWRNRLLLYYTGQQRLARGILENVVWRYLLRDPQTLEILKRLRQSAMTLAKGIEKRDFDCFAGEIETYWTLKKGIDPGSTNAGIEAILERTARWTRACVLPGAGGGGFILFVTENERNAQRIRNELEARPATAQSRFFDFDLDPYGLKVAVM